MPKRLELPLQPIVRDKDGVLRFQKNEIVAFLLDWASQRGMSLNEMARMPFDVADREQFAQLIGYSIGGFSELDYVRDDTYARAEAASKGIS